MARPSKRETALSRKKEDDDFSNEDVLKVARKFPIVLRKPLIFGMFLLIIGLLPWAVAYGNSYSWLNIAVWWLLFCMVALIYYWLIKWVGWYFSVFVLTDKRIVVTRQKGFFDRTVSELSLNNIQNVTYSIKGFQASVFHFGNISIATLSGSGGFDLKTVHHPERFARAIIKAAGLSSDGSTRQG